MISLPGGPVTADSSCQPRARPRGGGVTELKTRAFRARHTPITYLRYSLAALITMAVSPERVLTNVGARPGDMLVLTKPIGTGIFTTALKRGQLDAQSLTRVVEVMSQLNKAAAEALEGLRVHALTDVTGFGLLGHLVEMVAGSGVGARLHWPAIPVQPEAMALAEPGCVPGGTYRNLDHFGSAVRWPSETSTALQAVLADSQTSGGLLIAVDPEDVRQLTQRVASAAVIGEIIEGPPGVVDLGDV